MARVTIIDGSTKGNRPIIEKFPSPASADNYALFLGTWVWCIGDGEIFQCRITAMKYAKNIPVCQISRLRLDDVWVKF